MKIFYNGGYCPPHIFEKLRSIQKNPPSDARNKLEKMLLDGFAENGAQITAVCPILGMRSFPGNLRLFFRGGHYYWQGLNFRSISCVNILIVKQLFSAVASSFYLLTWLLQNKTDTDKCFFSYSVDTLTSAFCLALCRIFKCKTCVYVSEIPLYRLYHNQNSFLRKILLKFQVKADESLHKKFNGYVLSAPAIQGYYQLNVSQCLVIEGMIKLTAHKRTPSVSNDRFVVLYAGGLHRRNGIESLVQCILDLGDPKIELHLYGSGELNDDLQKIAKEHKQICFYGNVPNDLVLDAESQASLLINPRPFDEFTLYSFPSKTIEYMASGTPCAIIRLPSIPNDYDPYVYWLPNDNSQMAMCLRQIIKDPDRVAKGLGAQNFIYNHKNNVVQTRKILSWLSTNM